MTTVKVPRVLADVSHVSAIVDFGARGVFTDGDVKGLYFRVGPRSATWYFHSDRQDHGKRIVVRRKLGRYPDMGLIDARKAARIIDGRVLEGNAPAGPRSGTKLADAFEAYCGYLEAKATSKGKPPRWAQRVRSLGKLMIVPTWGAYTLGELSNMPREIADWHTRCAKDHGAVSANHAARVLRALYRRQARRDRSLSLENAPTTASKCGTRNGSKKVWPWPTSKPGTRPG